MNHKRSVELKGKRFHVIQLNEDGTCRVTDKIVRDAWGGVEDDDNTGSVSADAGYDLAKFHPYNPGYGFPDVMCPLKLPAVYAWAADLEKATESLRSEYLKRTQVLVATLATVLKQVQRTRDLHARELRSCP